MITEKTLDRIKKLIEHEKSARTIGSQAEAEAFAAKVQKMLLEHKLTMSDFEYEQQEATNPIVHKRIRMDEIGFERKDHKSKQPLWVAMLGMFIANSVYVKLVRSYDGVTFFGREQDVDTAIEMYKFLVSIACDIAEKDFKAYKRTSEYEADVIIKKLLRARKNGKNVEDIRVAGAVKKGWTESFFIGFYTAINKRLNGQKNEAESNASNQAMGLIRRDQIAIEDYRLATIGKVKAGRSRNIRVNGNAYQQGLKRGNETQLRSSSSHALSAGAN